VNGAAIQDSATVALTSTGGPDTTTSTLTADPDSILADGESTSLITVEVRDGNGDPVDADSVTVATTLGALGPVSHAALGRYIATLTAGTTTGTAMITGTVNGAAIQDSATVALTSTGGPDTTTSTVTADPDSILADGESTSLITVEVRDGNGDPVDADSVTVATTLGALGPVSHDALGRYIATLTAGTTTGTAMITGTVNGAAIQDSATVELASTGGPSTTTSTVTADPDSIPADGESTSLITVEVRDSDGDPVDADSVTVATTLGALGPVSHAEVGRYTATLTAGTTAGTAIVTGTVNGAAIQDSATVALTSTGGPDTTTSTVTADPDSILADGESTSLITVEVRDSNGDPVDADSVTLATTLGALGPVSHDEVGRYTATLTAGTTAGTAIITGTVNGAAIQDSATVALTSTGGPDTTTSTVTADPDSIPADGESTSLITVEVRDGNGDPVDADSVTVATTLGALGPVGHEALGRYTATLTAGTTAGTAIITGTVNGAAIQDSATVALTSTGGPDTTTSTLTADPDSILADGESTSLITVEVRDGNGDLVDADSVTVATTLGALGPVSHAALGRYTATLTAGTTAGTAIITGTVNGAAIQDSATVALTSTGGPDTTTSTVTADPDSIPADGESTSLITVEVRDSDGDPVDADSVTLATTLGALGSVSHAEVGRYTATLTAGTTAGAAIVTGTVNGAAIQDSATVELVPDSSDWIKAAVVTVDEGSTATNAGGFGDLGAGGTTFTASIGTVVGTGGGTWSWSFRATDGPDESQVVTIEGTDNAGGESSVTFDLVVNNVAPLPDAGQDRTIESGSVVTFSGRFSDPGVVDAPWSWIIDWGDGATSSGAIETQDEAVTGSHQFCAGGVHTITFSVTDKDGATGSDEATWTVEAVGVRIMIMPTDSPNSVSLSRRGMLPVAVLSGTDFDAANLDPSSITLGDAANPDTPVARRPDGSLFASVEDVDGDGIPDLVVHFRVPALVENGDLTPATTYLVLRGSGPEACGSVRGQDSVRVVP
jgi:adhesin/invasin